MESSPHAQWALKCSAVGAASVALAVYARWAARSSRSGASRLRLLAPVLVAFTLLPLAFRRADELLSRASCAAILFWLGNLKVLLLALGRGPLADPTLSLGQFVALCLWPVQHYEGPGGRVLRCEDALPHLSSGSGPPLPRRQRQRRLRQAALSRAMHRMGENLLIATVGAVTLVAPGVPLFLKTYSSAFGVYAYCDLFANLAAALVMALHGLAVAPSWDRPWLQNCLSDFWARRWNLPAAYSLRALIYEPMLEGHLVKPSSTSPDPASTSTSTGIATATATSSKLPLSTPPKHGQQQQQQQQQQREEGGPAELTDVSVQRLHRSGRGGGGTSGQGTGGEGFPGRFVATVTSPGGVAAVPPGAEPAGPAGEAERQGSEGKGKEVGGEMDEEGHLSSVVASLTRPGAPRPPKRASVTGTGSMDEEVEVAEDLVRLLDTSSPPSSSSVADAAAGAATGLRNRVHPVSSPAAPQPEGSKGAAPRSQRRATAAQRLAAMAATFAASGLLHEALILLCCGWEAWRHVAGRQMLYFLLQVPNSVVEQQLHRLCKASKWTPPNLLAIAVTSLSLQLPGLWLFWKPIWTAALTAMGKPSF